MPADIPTRPDVPVRTPLRTVAGWLGGHLVEIRNSGPDVEVTGLTLSSGAVRPGDVFAAPAGSRAHGASFAGDAVAAGAVAVLTDRPGAELCAELGVPILVVEQPRTVLGRLAARVYGEPARQLRLVAVTGTQGKTTTTRLAESAMTAAGTAAAVIGTVGTRVGGVELKTALTTPEAPELHALFAVMVERGIEVCAMEVSSHALVMGRVDGVLFDVACFTNLGRDHLDFHADEEDYFAAKASLFTPERARLGLVNVDDAHGRRLVREAPIPVRTFSVAGADADWSAREVRTGPTGSSFTLRGPGGTEVAVNVPLGGDFNVSNALCAVASLAEAGLDPQRVAEGMGRSTGVPGRLEQVDAGQDFVAVVDYAHKPDAVTAVLSSLRAQAEGRLIAVLGAGGERDEGKRPLMGEIAARLADVVVVTDDNPRSEDPARIRAAILAGANRVASTDRAELHEADDRRAAIRLAVQLARPGDVLLVAGKGHETGQEVAGSVQPFDDREVLREELASR